jgi:hypothetical protein
MDALQLLESEHDDLAAFRMRLYPDSVRWPTMPSDPCGMQKYVNCPGTSNVREYVAPPAMIPESHGYTCRSGEMGTGRCWVPLHSNYRRLVRPIRSSA